MTSTTHSFFEKHLTVQQDGQLLIDCLQELAPDFSKQQLKSCLQQGAVWVKEAPKHTQKGEKTTRPGRFRRAKKPLAAESEVFFYYNADVLNSTISPPILIEDCSSFSVWYKPKGVLCQGSKWGDHSCIHRWIEMNYVFAGEDQARACWIVHRLDKATDGIMLIAHSKKMAAQLAKAFENRQVKKQYQAKVVGEFPSEAQRFESPVQDKPALSIAKRLSFNEEDNTSWVTIEIATGRKHQIRIHLSAAGFPIVGDRLHGNTQHEDNAPNLQLSAIGLAFTLQQTEYRFTLPTELLNAK